MVALVSIDLTCNCLTAMPALDAAPCCRRLCLGQNRIGSMTPAPALPALRELELHHNQIGSLAGSPWKIHTRSDSIRARL